MIKKVMVTLLVTVDTENEEICPTGDPLAENVVLNHIDDGFIDPVEEIYTSHISDYVEHSKRIQKRIEDLYFNDPDYSNTYDRLYKEVMEEFPNMQHHDAALLVYSRWYELDNS